MGRKKWSEIRAGAAPEAIAYADARRPEMLAELALSELRQARSYTQTELGRRLGVRQASVSKMEHGADMYVSTLRGFVRALGGELEITARFPDGEPVRIRQFEDLEPADTGEHPAG